MKFKAIISTLVITAIPMAVQAGQASALTMKLHEPLSGLGQITIQDSESHNPMVNVSGEIENNRDSDAMAKARSNLNAKNYHVLVKEVEGDSLKLARASTK